MDTGTSFVCSSLEIAGTQHVVPLMATADLLSDTLPSDSQGLAANFGMRINVLPPCF